MNSLSKCITYMHMQISMNATLEIHAAMEHVKILMDLITAFVHQAIYLIQGGKVVLVSS